MRVTTGQLIKHFRIEKKLSAKEIAKGICSSSVMSEYENDAKIPDCLLFCSFMERMGVLPERFAIMATEEEYGYFLWKERVLNAIETQAWDKVHTLIEEAELKKKECNEKLEAQFLCYAKAVYEAKAKADYARAANYIKIAIQLTIDVDELETKEAIYGTTEISLLILYLYYGRLGETLDIVEGKKLFFKLEKYILEKRRKIDDATKVYPKLVCVGMHVLSDILCCDEKRQICETAINMLREYRDMYDILELLRLYIPLISDKEEIAYHTKNLEVFETLWERAKMVTSFQPETLYFQMPKVYLISEFLYSKRKEKKLTQELLSEGICEPETYSRLESGKRKPKKNKYYALMDRLEIGWAYFRGDLYTNDIKMYELRRLHRIAAQEERCADSLAILNEMEQGLDMTHPVNIQYIKANQIMMNYRLNNLSKDEAYLKMKTLLEITKKMDSVFYNLSYYTQTEVETITYMAQMLRAMGKSAEGIVLLENVLKQSGCSKVVIANQGSGVCFLLKVLSGLYFEIGEYEKSIKTLDEVFHLIMGIYSPGTIPAILDAYADNLEHMGTQYSEEYQLLYRQSYYVAEFYYNTKVADFMKKYYEESFGTIEWYCI